MAEPPEPNPRRPRAPALSEAAVAADAAADVVATAVDVGRGVADAARDVAEDALGVLLDVLESMASTVRRVLAGLMALAVALLVLAGFAAFQPEQFRQSFPYLFALFASVLGLLLFWLAWRLQGATGSLITVAKMARKWRDRAARREAR